MTDKKHTPEKWEISRGNIVVKGRDSRGYYSERKIAKGIPSISNANLIASAPEMLEMLKNAKGVVSLTSPSMADKIKNLLAKAEGSE